MADTRLFANGKEVLGYLNAGDGRSGKPQVVVIHEFWGLTDQIKGVVDRLAKDGFAAFAPDLYNGKVATTRDEANALSKKLDWDGAEMMLRAAAQGMLARDPSRKVAVMGYCLGGALALMAGAKIPEYSAVVTYYGIPNADRADLSQIKARVQGHFALTDDWCTAELISELEKRLGAGNVPFEVHRYDAHHAFANETRPEVYSAKDAELAWERTVKFLEDAIRSA